MIIPCPLPPLLNPKYLHIVDEFKIAKKISIPEAEELFNMKWLEWDISKTKVIYSPLENITIKPRNYSIGALTNKLKVCFMNAECGWSVFARQFIKKGTIISVCTGEISFQPKSKKYFGESVFLSNAPNDQYLVINGSYNGNITRFLQHLPSKEELEKYKFDKDVKKTDIATANIALAVVSSIEDFQVGLVIAARDIAPDEIIGVTYRQEAWQDKKPLIFKKDGSIVSVSN